MMLDEDRDFIDVHARARRMDLSVPRVMELVRRKALRSIHLGFGEVLVEPALVNSS
jgi:hypothetical protein